jgi:hypothetical protein
MISGKPVEIHSLATNDIRVATATGEFLHCPRCGFSNFLTEAQHFIARHPHPDVSAVRLVGGVASAAAASGGTGSKLLLRPGLLAPATPARPLGNAEVLLEHRAAAGALGGDHESSEVLTIAMHHVPGRSNVDKDESTAEQVCPVPDQHRHH